MPTEKARITGPTGQDASYRKGPSREEILLLMADSSETRAGGKRPVPIATPVEILQTRREAALAGGSAAVASVPPVELGDLLTIERSADFVRAVYMRMFGREGEAEWVTHWQRRLQAGMPRYEMLLEFSRCEEAAQAEYVFHGVPLASAVQVLAGAGASLSRPEPSEPPLELAGLCAIRDDAAFLQAAYQAILDRAPDPAGLEFQLEGLREGSGREELLLRMAGSPEAQAGGRKFVLIGTPVEALHAGLQATSARASAMPTSTPAVELGDLLTIEHNVNFVRAAFQRMLGRGGEPAWVAHWQHRLDSGTPRSVMLLDISRSEEAPPAHFRFIPFHWRSLPRRSKARALRGLHRPTAFLRRRLRSLCPSRRRHGMRTQRMRPATFERSILAISMNFKILARSSMKSIAGSSAGRRTSRNSGTIGLSFVMAGPGRNFWHGWRNPPRPGSAV
jgi:hypothetical protein